MAYALLNKVGSHKEGTSIMIGDRVRKIALAGARVDLCMKTFIIV